MYYIVKVRANIHPRADTKACVQWIRNMHQGMSAVEGLTQYRQLQKGDTWTFNAFTEPTGCPHGLLFDTDVYRDQWELLDIERERTYAEATALLNAGAAGDATAAIEFCRRELAGENPNWGAAYG